MIPSFLSPDLIGTSPLLGFPGKERSLLAFFKGDVGEHRLPHYSRGLRQKLHHLARCPFFEICKIKLMRLPVLGARPRLN